MHLPHLRRATPALVLVLLASLASGACYRRADLYGRLGESGDRSSRTGARDPSSGAADQARGAADRAHGAPDQARGAVDQPPALLPEPLSIAEEAVEVLAPAWAYRVAAGDEELPAVAREFRGVWVATVGNMDWPSRRSLTTSQAKAELLRILDAAADAGLNAVILQVRPMADAFYESALEPWSDYLTGESGVAPDPYWDPLAFAIEEAHARGLELHAWFNPFRAGFTAKRAPLHPSHISRRRPDLLRTYGRHYWLDPGEPDARAHAIAVITDVVRRYDVDAVHIDDYFYPYQERDARNRLIQFPDEASWREHGVRTGLSRADWRRSNVDAFVEQLYSAVRAEKRHVRVGISPFGIWRPGHPSGVRGLDAYAELFADTRKWLNNGWADYYAPQLYWRVAAPEQRYTELLQWWSEQNTHGRHLWAGNHPNRVGDRTNDWDPDEILEQVRLTREHAGATGNVHFSASTLLRNSRGLSDAFRSQVYASPALVPASPWLAAAPQAPPLVEAAADAQTRTTVLTLHAMPQKASRWIVHVRRGEEWETVLLPGGSRDVVIDWGGAAPPAGIAVRVVDRAGVESEAAVLRLEADVRRR